MTTTLDSNSHPLDIRLEALHRVEEQARANGQIQDDVKASFFFSARAKLAEAAIRKEIADKQKEKAKASEDYAKEIIDSVKVDDKPPEKAAGTLAGDRNYDISPARIATREEQQNMLFMLDRNYRFMFEQLAGVNNALDEIQAENKTLKDKLESTEDRLKALEQADRK